MTAKANNAAGGTNGATVTPGNSGGASGTAWDAATITGSATLTFDNTHVWDSPLAYELSTPAVAATTFLVWSTSFNDDEVWTTFYGFFTTFAGIASSTCCRARGSGVQAARVFWNTSGQLRIADTTTTNAVAMTTACPTNAWFRVDVHVKVSTGAGDVWLFKTNPDGQVGNHDDHISTSGALYGANPITEFSFGVVSNSASVGPFWLSNLGASNVGIVGPPNMWIPYQQKRYRARPVVPRRRPNVTVFQHQMAPPQSRHPRPLAPRIPKVRPARLVLPQIAPAPPVYPPQRRSLRVRLPRLTRPRGANVVQAQAAPPPPAYVPQAQHIRARVFRWLRRRPTQHVATHTAPPVNQRIRARLVRLWRRTPRQVVPAQVVLIPPPYVPQSSRVRRSGWGIRHAGGSNDGWMTTDMCAPVTRPNTGTVTRPNSGMVGRPSLGLVTRPDSGTVTRPDEGTVDRPC